jgi:membrane-associated phospholipid phosphatase
MRASKQLADETAESQAPAQRPLPVFPKWTFWLALSSFALGAALLLDGPVDAAMLVQSHGALRMFAQWLTKVGEWWSVGLAGLAIALFFFFRGRFKTARETLFATLAGLATGFTAALLRSLIGRARPNAQAPQGFYGLWHNSHWIFGQYQFSSFPSGHAATLVGLAAAAWMVNRWAGVGTGLFALMVSWSRVAQSSHHFSDIIAAAILGLWLAPWLQDRFRAALKPAFCAIEGSWRNYLRGRRLQKRPSFVNAPS